LFSAQENLEKIFRFIKTLHGLLFIVASVSICIFSVYFITSIDKPNNIHEPLTLIIKPGSSSLKIATILANNRVINNKWIFLLYVKTVAQSRKLVAGEYEFLPGQSLKSVVKIICDGESIVRKIKIPEGYTSSQIIDLLLKEERLVGTIQSDTIQEGSLFPDTYYFKYGDLRSKIIKLMRERMRSTLDRLVPQLANNSFIDNEEKLINLASIVEKEAGNDVEKPIIASVFLNRIKKNMPLQADPTVIYGITMGKSSFGRVLTKKDLLFDSPYNTYIYRGLPPGPIACPGLKSLQSVINPAKTNYIYFVADGKGGHNYSINLEDHNIFVKILRKAQN